MTNLMFLNCDQKKKKKPKSSWSLSMLKVTSIPCTLGDLKAMTQKQNISHYLYPTLGKARSYEDSLILNVKGQDLEYIKYISLIVNIDLSTNNFSAEFPIGIKKLSIP